MRVFYIANGTARDGSNTALLALLRILRAKGCEAEVAACPTPGADFLPQELARLGIPFRSVALRPKVYPASLDPVLFVPRVLHTLLVCRRARGEVERLVRSFHPDLIHTNVGVIDVGFDIAQRLHIPHCWHLREYTGRYPGLRFFPRQSSFLRKIHSEGNFNICITRGIFDWFHGRDEDRVVYDGVASPVVPVPAAPHDSPYMLFVGRVEEGKGALGVVEAFASLAGEFPSLRLRVAGEEQRGSAYSRRCRTETERRGLSSRVDFLGHRNDVASLMAGAALTVVNSPFEGFGFTTAEAMLQGCPVVGRDTTGTKEQFDNGLALTGQEIGLRFTDEAGLRRQLRFALTHDLSDMTRRARQTALHFYSTETNAASVEAFYGDILKRSR